MKPVRIVIAAGLVLGLVACGSSGNNGASGDNNGGTNGSPASTAGTSGTGGGGGSVTTLRVAANGNAGVLPLIIAQDQGFFQKHNLDVKFTKAASIANLPQALGTSYDIVFTVPTAVINANAQGVDLVPVAGATLQAQANKQSFLIASSKSGVKNLADLAGKTIGTETVGGTLNLATQVLLKQAGVDLSTIKFIQVGGANQGDQLKQGRVDAVEAVAPFSAAILADKSNVNLGSCYRALGDSVAAIGWVAKKDWAVSHKDAIDEFKKALDDGIAYIKANESQARDALQKFSGLPAAVLDQTSLPTFTSQVRESDWKAWLSAMQQINGFKGQVDINSIVNW